MSLIDLAIILVAGLIPYFPIKIGYIIKGICDILTSADDTLKPIVPIKATRLACAANLFIVSLGGDLAKEARFCSSSKNILVDLLSGPASSFCIFEYSPSKSDITSFISLECFIRAICAPMSYALCRNASSAFSIYPSSPWPCLPRLISCLANEDSGIVCKNICKNSCCTSFLTLASVNNCRVCATNVSGTFPLPLTIS